MCVTAVLAGAALLASAVGTYSSMQASKAQAEQAQAMERLRRKQLAETGAMERIAASQREIGRMNAYETQRSSNLAAIGASGLGDHISFFQGIEPSNRDNLEQDIRAIRLNLTQKESQIADGIEVSEYAGQMAGYNARMSNIGALANFAGDVANVYSFYQTNKGA